MLDIFQSGFRAFHSTETALLKVTNDILCSLDFGDGVILILLELSAAFDSRSLHFIKSPGESGWYSGGCVKLVLLISQRSNILSIGKHNSSSTLITCGVPQSSILSPLLFLYT